jgi:hypothetical protein
MRSIRIILAAGLILALSEAAWAYVAPPPPGGSIYTFSRSRNQDMGTSYTTDSTASPPLNTPFDPHVTNLGGAVTITPPRGQMGQTEDSWGLAFLYQLSTGRTAADGSIQPQPGGLYYDNSAGDQGTWLVAMFYGGTDRQIVLRTPAAGHVSDFQIVTTGTKIELWAVDKAALSALADPNLLLDYTPGARTAPNQYIGWLDALSEANGERLLTGTSRYQFFNGGVSDNGKFDGTSNIYFDVDPGSGAWDALAGSNYFPTPLLSGGTGSNSDMFLTFADQFSDTWGASSSDQGGWAGHAPEPATLGLLLVGGLAIIRRRRR